MSGNEDKKFDKYDEMGQLAGGFDVNLAREAAVKHAHEQLSKEKRWLQGMQFAWEIDSAKFDEEEDCYKVILLCYPEDAEIEEKAHWEYHIDALGNLYAGTPKLISRGKWEIVAQHEQELKFCGYCGQINGVDATFCKSCGKELPLIKEEEAEAVARKQAEEQKLREQQEEAERKRVEEEKRKAEEHKQREREEADRKRLEEEKRRKEDQRKREEETARKRAEEARRKEQKAIAYKWAEEEKRRKKREKEERKAQATTDKTTKKSNKKQVFITMSTLVVVALVVIGIIALVGDLGGEKCQTYYWFDETSSECGQKEFCEDFEYPGLQVFETQSECVSAFTTAHPTEDEVCQDYFWFDEASIKCEPSCAHPDPRSNIFLTQSECESAFAAAHRTEDLKVEPATHVIVIDLSQSQEADIVDLTITNHGYAKKNLSVSVSEDLSKNFEIKFFIPDGSESFPELEQGGSISLKMSISARPGIGLNTFSGKMVFRNEDTPGLLNVVSEHILISIATIDSEKDFLEH